MNEVKRAHSPLARSLALVDHTATMQSADLCERGLCLTAEASFATSSIYVTWPAGLARRPTDGKVLLDRTNVNETIRTPAIAPNKF